LLAPPTSVALSKEAAPFIRKRNGGTTGAGNAALD
jgi:hypothetical protein